MNKRGRPKNPLDTNTIRKLAAEGMSDKQIAGTLHVSLDGVYKHRQTHGIRSGTEYRREENIKRAGVMIANGATNQEIAAELDINVSTAYNYRQTFYPRKPKLQAQQKPMQRSRQYD